MSLKCGSACLFITRKCGKTCFLFTVAIQFCQSSRHRSDNFCCCHSRNSAVYMTRAEPGSVGPHEHHPSEMFIICSLIFILSKRRFYRRKKVSDAYSPILLWEKHLRRRKSVQTQYDCIPIKKEQHSLPHLTLNLSSRLLDISSIYLKLHFATQNHNDLLSCKQSVTPPLCICNNPIHRRLCVTEDMTDSFLTRQLPEDSEESSASSFTFSSDDNFHKVTKQSIPTDKPVLVVFSYSSLVYIAYIVNEESQALEYLADRRL